MPLDAITEAAADQPRASAGELIPRATVEQIVAHRDRALELYAAAFDKITEAAEALQAAHAEAAKATLGHQSRWYTDDRVAEIKEFHEAVKLPRRDRFLRTARKLTDLRVWAWVVEYTDLRRLMDKEAKDKLDQQMRYTSEEELTRETVRWRDGESADEFAERREAAAKQLIDEHEAGRGMPAVTVENIRATLESFAADSDMIFRRGLANAFSKLDRRFRSHDGFKIGGRVILTYFFDSIMGGISWGGGQADTLIDIERAFVVLDGKPSGLIGTSLDQLRGQRPGYGPRQSEVDTRYFKIRGYKNGNAHLWFTRDDLVEKVNKLLAEWYGEVIGDARTQEADLFQNRKLTPARRFGFFPTPPEAAAKVIELAGLYQHADRASGKMPAPLTILEPSAGTGNLARLCATVRRSADKREWNEARKEYVNEDLGLFGHKVDCVELQPALARQLRAEGIYRRVTAGDFLLLQPDPKRLYDRVAMNPPFDLLRDVDHVVHALKFLKPDGRLVAIMSAGTEFRSDRKSAAFRKLMIERGARFHDLPAGSFASVGTYVNTILVTVGGGADHWSGQRFQP
jgi:hypothetical protein